MKKWFSLLLCAALLGFCFGALAESSYTYYPEAEAFVGSWISGDYELTIVHSEEDANLFDCTIMQLSEAGEGFSYVYSGCSYDDIGCALASFEVGVKRAISLDGSGEIVEGEIVFENGAAAFAIAEDGKLTWTDFMETPGENEIVFERAATALDAQVSDLLHASIQPVIDSPEWIASLPQAQDENTTQLFVVAGMGMELTTASVSMHQRDENGNWKQILSTPGYVGRNGLVLDAERAEGCGQTPVGVYHFNRAFGIADDPGCAIEYVKVDDNTWWSGDPAYHYNEMVDIRDCPDLARDDSEHIVDYEYQYQYCLNISFNEDGTPGRGSAIFLHCLGPTKPYTGGCVALPENLMRLVMQNVHEDCVVVIDTLENLGGTL